MDNGFEEIYRVPGDKPMFLHCCPWWLVRSPAVREVAMYTAEASNGNLAAYFAPGSVPAALRNSMRMYDAGYHKGLKKRREIDRD